MWKGWIVGLAGIWAFLSPFFHFASVGNAWSDWIVGVVGVIFGFSMMSEHPAQSWICGIGAVWMFIAGFIPGLLMAPGVWWNNLIMGAILAIFGFAATRTTQHMTPTGAQAQ